MTVSPHAGTKKFLEHGSFEVRIPACGDYAAPPQTKSKIFIKGETKNESKSNPDQNDRRDVLRP